ncbi:MAG: peptidoglycan bridge formation glycyltransferase FemA/FemB family protein [Candidatus Microsaccharimonas sp.]
MSQYQFKEVSLEDIADYLNSHAQGSFAQSPAMAEVRKDSERDVHFVAVYEDEKIVAACQLSIINGRFKSADITAGPLLNFTNTNLLEYFTTQIKDYCKKQQCVYLTINPNIEYSETVLTNLKQLGWEYSGRLNTSAVGLRGGIRWMYVKVLASQTVENYQDAYVKRHRRYIRNADPDVSIRQLDRDELNIFFKIMQHTAERRHFASRSDAYFYSLYDRFGEQATFLIAELKQGGEKIPFAGIVFIESNNETVSYLGGAISEYAKYRGSYLLHDAMIKRSIEKGYKQYNFYGIEGDITNPQSEGYGIYEFKTKFGTGRAVELIGEFVLPILKTKFKLFQFIRKILK